MWKKTKVIRFKERGRRMKKVEWKWRGKEIEEVKEFKHLGYAMTRKGEQEAHVRRSMKGAMIDHNERSLGIEKRRFDTK